MGSGIACGVAAGKRKARDDFRDFAERHNITIQNQEGKPVSLDEFLNEALGIDDAKHKKVAIVAALVGALVFLGTAFLYFLELFKWIGG